MRPLLLACLFLVGCGQARTVSHAEAEKLRAEIAAQPAHEHMGKSTDRASESIPEFYESPSYAEPMPVVFNAAVRACADYYHTLKVIDRERSRIEIETRNAWSGSSDIVVQLSEEAGRTLVSIESKSASIDNNLGRCRRDVREIVARLATQMDPAFRETTNPGD